MIVDHQAHWYPPAYLDSICGRDRYPRAEKLGDGRYRYEIGEHADAWRFDIASRFTDIDEQIAVMDAAGIAMAVISPNMVGDGAAEMELAEAQETLRFLNAETARVQAEHEQRLVGLCMLPFQDTAAALEELEHAAELDLRGVFLPSNIGGRAPIGPETWPVFERIDELGLPVFVHPASNSMLFDRGLAPTLDWSAGWMWESSAAVLSMILTGLLDRCPRIEVVHAHMGGIVPFVAGRVDRYAGYTPEPLEHPVAHYLQTRVYADVVSHTPGVVALAAQTYGATRLLYGSDYPWHDHEERLTFIEQNMNEQLAHSVLHTNRVASLRLS